MESNFDKKPMVSIQMLAYNHEKYIKQALDSILMQEVKFTYEIIIGEDCSTDKTRAILLGYKEKYPDKIKLILHGKNVGMHENVEIVRRNCSGKYCAYCEGDDYWTDPKKLQKQVDFLEENTEYIATTHKMQVVDENSNLQSGYNMSMFCKDTIYTIKHAEKGIMPGQIASWVYRNTLAQDPLAMELLNNCRANGDAKTALYLVLSGKVYCSDEVMSHYRWVTNGGDSWNARIRKKNLYLYTFISYTELAKLAKKLKNIDMNYNSLYLSFGYGAFMKWLKSPNKDNRKILVEIYKRYINKTELICYILKKCLLYPFVKIRRVLA